MKVIVATNQSDGYSYVVGVWNAADYTADEVEELILADDPEAEFGDHCIEISIEEVSSKNYSPHKSEVFEYTERDILQMTNQHFNIKADSIVALEELSNQVWVVEIYAEDEDPGEFLHLVRGQMDVRVYRFRDALNKMCFDGVLQAGTYNIDCTW